MRGRVWVEIETVFGPPVRIFRSQAAAMSSLALVKEYPKVDAVRAIRERIYKEADGRCRNCGIMVVGSGHMHELVPRGKGGEISIWNSIILCSKCHLQKEHGDRQPRFGEAS